MTDQELRLRCFELACSFEYVSDDKLKLNDIFEIAEKIYNFTCRTEIGLKDDEATWIEYQKKLESTIKYAVPTSQNKKVKIRV